MTPPAAHLIAFGQVRVPVCLIAVDDAVTPVGAVTDDEALAGLVTKT
jgi:hypothetical protein